jgi:2-phospho-L-lactate guanylyltransferase
MILVPIKNLADAKQRLSPVLNPGERFALAQAMCEDVLQALADWQGRPAVAVVTSDSFARDLAARFNFEVIADDNSGETSAIEMATTVCREHGASSTLVVPADIPLIEASELQKIVDVAPVHGAVLAPHGDLRVIYFLCASATIVSCRTRRPRRQRACLASSSNCRVLRVMWIVLKIFMS